MSEPEVTAPLTVAEIKREKMEKRDRVARVDGAFEVVGSFFCIWIVLRWEWFLQVLDMMGMPNFVPVPSVAVIERFQAWIIAVALIGAVVGGMKVFSRRWNYPLAAAFTVHRLFDSWVLLMVVTSGQLLRNETIESWAQMTGRSFTQIQISSSIFLTIIALFIVAISLGSCVYRWVQASRQGL